MKRVDTDGHVGNLFDEGDPLVPRNPTQVDSTWLNNVQETVVHPIEAAGITLDPDDDEQLTDAIKALIRDFAGTFTALQTFNAGIAGTRSTYALPFIEDTGSMGSDDRRLIFVGGVGTSTMKLRIYRSKFNTIDLALNAAWDQSLGQWVPDVSGSSSVYPFGSDHKRAFRKASVTGGVAFSSWDVDIANAVTLVSAGFSTGWAASTCGYWLDSEGTVHLQGAVQRGSGGTDSAHTSFFPAGFRPGGTILVPIVNLDGATKTITWCSISAGGAITLDSGVNSTSLSFLEGITFRAEN